MNINQILFILISVQISFSQTTFIKTYGDTADQHDDVGHAVLQTEGGGYIIAGETGRYDIYGHPIKYYGDVCLIKTDEYGDTIWIKTYGDSGALREGSFSMDRTNDGGYMLSAYEEKNWRLWLIRTDSNGDSIWSRKYPVGKGNCIKKTSDDGFVITGYTINDIHSAYLIKINSMGDTLWLKTYNKSDQDEAKYVQQTSDGGFIICGVTKLPEPRDLDIWLLKTDSNGDTLWTKTYGGDYIDEPQSVYETSEGGYFIAGEYTVYGELGLEVHIWLLKTDSNGDTLWTKKINNGSWGDNVYACNRTSDGGFIIVGETIYDNFDSDIYIIKLDEEYNYQWTSAIGGKYINDFNISDLNEYHFRGNDIQETSDGGYIITGFRWLYINPFPWKEYIDICLVKVDNKGQITGIKQINTKDNMNWDLQQNFPNPFNSTTQIKFSIPQKEHVCLTIYDMLGREIITLFNEEKGSGMHSVFWYGKNKFGETVSSGVYMYKLKAGTIIRCKKMVYIK